MWQFFHCNTLNVVCLCKTVLCWPSQWVQVMWLQIPSSIPHHIPCRPQWWAIQLLIQRKHPQKRETHSQMWPETWVPALQNKAVWYDNQKSSMLKLWNCDISTTPALHWTVAWKRSTELRCRLFKIPNLPTPPRTHEGSDEYKHMDGTAETQPHI